MAYIYCLKDPITYKVRYIGYTSNGFKDRLNDHVKSRNRSETHKNKWIRTLVKQKKKPTIHLLERMCQVAKGKLGQYKGWTIL